MAVKKKKVKKVLEKKVVKKPKTITTLNDISFIPKGGTHVKTYYDVRQQTDVMTSDHLGIIRYDKGLGYNYIPTHSIHLTGEMLEDIIKHIDRVNFDNA